MGYAVRRGSALLAFEEGGYAGVEARVWLDVPLGEFLAFRERLREASKPDDPMTEERALRTFVESRIADWNLTFEDGRAVPVTWEGVLEAGVPSDLLYSLMQGFWGAVADYVKPAAPLARPSLNGTRSEEESAAMGR